VTGLRRHPARLGVAAMALGVFCAAMIFASLAPMLATPDETAHVDYAYQVWNGRLPVFEDGTRVEVGEGAKVPPVQWSAQHPPLFYVVMAPVVGPLAEAGHWRMAVMAGRVVCALIAAGCVLALGWAGSLLAGRDRQRWALVVPATVAPVAPLIGVGGSVYNDNLALLLTIGSLGAAFVILRQGLTRWRLLLVAVLCGLGALARANFVVTLVAVSVCLLAAGLAAPDTPLRRALAGVRAASVPWVAAAVSSGWFYARNVTLTGSWTGGHPDWAAENLGRSSLSISEVLEHRDFWIAQTTILRRSGRPFETLSTRWLLGTLLAIALTAGLVKLAQARRRPPDRRSLVIAGVLALQAAGAIALQVAHFATGGGSITRYLLPALLPLGAALAAGILALGRRLSPLALAAYVTMAWWGFVVWATSIADPTGPSLWGRTVNNMPGLLVWTGLVGLGLALVAQVVGLCLVEAGRHRQPAEHLAAAPSRPAPEPLPL
jgi:4-amino-4-deoxy-L-arabinose transferase-like glycosyltransferase